MREGKFRFETMIVTFTKLGLHGRLGNQMFQIAASLAFAYDWIHRSQSDRSESVVEESELMTVVRLPSDNLDWLDVFPHCSNYFCSLREIEKLMVESLIGVHTAKEFCPPVPFDTPQNPNVVVDLLGYFQCDSYWKDKQIRLVRGNVVVSFEYYLTRILFHPSVSSLNKLESFFVRHELNPEQCCSVHVRRGDYLSIQQTFPVMSQEYYADAAARVLNALAERFPHTSTTLTVLVFSDDEEWCQRQSFHLSFLIAAAERLDLLRCSIRVHTCDSDDRSSFLSKDVLEMLAMSACGGHVLSNSSFSWWASALHLSDKEPVTVAPSVWFGNGDNDPSLSPMLRNHGSIFRKEWIRSQVR